MSVFAYTRKTNYYETDCMGIIHHSNYFRYFEEARTALMDNLGLSYAKMERDGIVSPVLHVECDYRLPVKFGETIDISVLITEYNGFRLKCEYSVTDHETGAVRTKGSSSHCFVSSESGHPVRLKKAMPEVHEAFQKYFEDCSHEKNENSEDKKTD